MGKKRFTGKNLSHRKRLIIIVVGLGLGFLPLVLTTNMVRMLREKEENEVSLWAYAMERIGEINSEDPLVSHVINNQQIPFILINEMGRVEQSNLISQKILDHPDLCTKKIIELSNQNKPREINAWTGKNYILFYGNSHLLKWLLIFPFAQLLIIVIYVAFGYIAFSSSRRNEQNRVWIGLAKETAHQLGTPISSLLGWMEYLRSQNIDSSAVDDMSKDLTRLIKVADRFSKIGSETEHTSVNINEVVGESVLYFKTRIPKNVTLLYNGLAIAPIKAKINSSLFEWVIENLLKNALDALQGSGDIDINISENNNLIYIDIKDTGKGISKSNQKRIFEPGYTTKTRGWGLGLSLSRRIIEEYHKGEISVLRSEKGKGTTMRIVIKKEEK